MTANASLLVGSPVGAAFASPPAGAAAAGFFASIASGISLYSSMAALEMTVLSRSCTLQRKMILPSASFHISVTSVSPGNTLSEKRTWMLLK